nr:A396 [uncultured bacterium]
MTNEQIDGLIDQLNTAAGSAVIIPRALTEKVAVAHVWPRDLSDYIQVSPDRFFFVKADGRDYVGAVQDGGPSDMHVYIKRDFRGQGILATALDDVIFPWLAQVDGRSEQRLTFQEPKVKRHFAGRLGFRSTGELSSRRSLQAYRKRCVDFVPSPSITAAAFADMKQRLDRASQWVEMVRVQVESHGLGRDGSKTAADLRKALNCLGGLDDRIRYDANDAQGIWL